MKLISFARLAVLLALGSAPQVWAFSEGSDSFSGAPTITASNEFSNGTNLTTYTVEAGEPAHDGFGGAAKTAWWKWTAPETGYCTVDTRLTATDTQGVLNTIMGVYTGTFVDDLTLVANNDDYALVTLAGDGAYSSVTFYATAGQVYRIAVDAYDDSYVNVDHHNVYMRVRLLALKTTVRDAVWRLNNTLDGAGSVTMAMTATGSLSGKMTVGGRVLPFKGFFDSRGYYQVAFPPPPTKPGQLPLTMMTLTVDGAGDEGQMSVDNGSRYTNVYFPRRTVYSAQNPNLKAGNYTFYSQGVDESGNASGLIKVATNGTAKGAGTAFDGTAFTFSSTLNAGHSVDFSKLSGFTLLSGKKGYFQFSAEIQENGAEDSLSGFCTYLRPAGSATAVYYPEGLLLSFKSMFGGTYTKPAPQTRALGFLNQLSGDGVLLVSNAKNELELGEVTEPLNLDTKNKFTFDSLTLKPTLKLNTATGQVTGSIMEPGQKKRSFKGMLVKFNNTVSLRGVCSGTTQALQFSVVSP